MSERSNHGAMLSMVIISIVGAMLVPLIIGVMLTQPKADGVSICDWEFNKKNNCYIPDGAKEDTNLIRRTINGKYITIITWRYTDEQKARNKKQCYNQKPSTDAH